MLGLALVACGGDDGDQGPRGEAGPPPIVGERTVAPDEVNPEITGVRVSSPMVVEFQVTDENGFAVRGIDEGVQFTVNKLIPGSDGETNVWHAYTRAADDGVANAQAATYSDGTLVDHGDGTYTFTFADELEDISNVAFEPDLTHRVGIELRDVVILGEEIPAGSNAVYDFQPSTGATTGITKRTIAETESCQTCHGPEAFSFHGGPRKQVEYCVTCHQKGSIDEETDNTMDFRVMIHKIHTGENLNNLPYQFCGFTCEAPFIGGGAGTPLDDFSHVAFPQDTRNCTTCHDPDDPDTPQASNVFDRPTAAVCASCHDDLAFDDTGLTNANGNHEVAGAQPDSNCVNCHTTGGLSVENAHEIPGQVAAARFEYNILDIAQTGPGSSPMITFSITDPTNGDAPYDLANDPEMDSANGASVNMDIAWPTSDYTNVNADTGSVIGTPPSRPISISLLQGPPVIVDNGDGTYTVDASQIPFSVPSAQTGSGAVAIEGHPATEIEGSFVEAPVTGAVDYFAITDSSPQARRTVVDSAKCQDCHGNNDGLAFHGGNRTDNTKLCVVCHNPNQTDLFMRPAAPDGDPDEAFNGENTAAVDGLEDRTIDFKYMIHAIHGSSMRDNAYTAYGFGLNAHTYSDVGFPRPVSDCQACHAEGTYELPVGSNVLATTLSSGATVDTTQGGFSNPGATAFLPADGSASDPTDDNNASPTAAVCSSCHDSASAAEHMDRTGTSGTSFGDAFLLNPNYPTDPPHTQADIDTALPAGENCAFCHGSGGIADVAEVHGVE